MAPIRTRCIRFYLRLVQGIAERIHRNYNRRATLCRKREADSGELFGDLPEFGGEGFVVGLLFGANLDGIAAHLSEAVGTVEMAALRVGRRGAVECGERSLRVRLGDEADNERGHDGLEACAGAGSCGEEIRVRDAGMDDDAHGGSVRALETAVEFESEEKIGELGAAVRGPRLVVVFPVEVVEVHGGSAVGNGADGDDAWRRGRCGLKDRWEQEAGEGEVAEVVGAELELESIGSDATLGKGHDAGVVDEEVEAAVGGEEGLSSGTNGGEAGEVELRDFELGCRNLGEDSFASRFSFRLIAAGENDGGSVAGEFEGGVIADAAVGSCDVGELAMLRGDLGGGPVGHRSAQLSGSGVAIGCGPLAE
jgi:hypothetical protein